MMTGGRTKVDRAVAIIERGGRYLVIRREREGRVYHVLPGGGVKPGKTAAAACRREVWEETGLHVAGLRPVVVALNGGRREHYFVVQVAAGEPRLGWPEADRESGDNSYTLIWVPRNDLSAMNLLPLKAKELILGLSACES